MVHSTGQHWSFVLSRMFRGFLPSYVLFSVGKSCSKFLLNKCRATEHFFCLQGCSVLFASFDQFLNTCLFRATPLSMTEKFCSVECLIRLTRPLIFEVLLQSNGSALCRERFGYEMWRNLVLPPFVIPNGGVYFYICSFQIGILHNSKRRAAE